jgi:hypothetical protein
MKKEVTEMQLVKTDVKQRQAYIDGIYKDFNGIAARYEKQTAMEVQDDKDMTKAEQVIRSINEDLGKISEQTKKHKNGFYWFWKKINETEKIYTAPLESYKKQLNRKVTAFKELKIARAKAEKEEEDKKIQERADERRKEGEFIVRLGQKCAAMLTGGRYVSLKDQIETYQTPKTEKEIDDILDTIKNNFPSTKQFNYFPEKIADLRENLIVKGMELKKHIINIEKEGMKEDAAKGIAEIKNELTAEYHKTEDRMRKEVSHLKKAELKEFKDKEREAHKGLRTDIKFGVENKDNVPSDYLTVDEKEVNEFIRSNRHKILELIKENKTPIPGLKFYTETRTIVRS